MPAREDREGPRVEVVLADKEHGDQHVGDQAKGKVWTAKYANWSQRLSDSFPISCQQIGGQRKDGNAEDQLT